MQNHFLLSEFSNASNLPMTYFYHIVCENYLKKSKDYVVQDYRKALSTALEIL